MEKKTSSRIGVVIDRQPGLSFPRESSPKACLHLSNTCLPLVLSPPRDSVSPLMGGACLGGVHDAAAPSKRPAPPPADGALLHLWCRFQFNVAWIYKKNNNNKIKQSLIKSTKYERSHLEAEHRRDIGQRRSGLEITMHLTAWLLILVVTGIAKGWECSAGCNPENGFCERPGKCRCKPGWQGGNCNQCVPFPGCLHGTCEKAWQCVCEEGWVGSLCDQDTRQCSSRPCAGNATCIETGEGGYLCICPPGYAGEKCDLKRGVCITNSSPCQNGGTCMDGDGSAAYSSCLCPPGFSGAVCEISVDSCQPNPCLNGGNCTNYGLAFTCVCPHGFTGFTCNDTISLSPCAGRPCANGGTCLGQPDGTFRCVCQKWFTGPTCSLQERQKARSKPVGARPADHRVFSLTPQHYSLPAHAFHKLLRPPERDLLKITLKETVHSPGILVTHGQLVCFGMLALLTCLVILGTTGIVFFGRCETWLANAKYSQLVRQQREHLLREAGGASQEELEHSVNIILPEKIRLTSFGRHYTSI